MDPQNIDVVLIEEDDVRIISVGEVGPAGVDGWTGKPRQHVQVYSPTMTLDCSLYDVFDINLTGNATINFTGGQDGQKILVRVRQGTSGNHSVAWGSRVIYGDDILSIPLSTVATKMDLVAFVYRAADDGYFAAAYIRGFVTVP